MDYDHVRGVKIDNVSRFLKNNASLDKIKDEISKCDLVCCLCHNKRTHDRKPIPNHTKNKKRSIDIINEFKNNPCYVCGIKYESYNMQCDHIDFINKTSNICNLKGRKIETLLLELEKCKPVCAMCHRTKSLNEAKEYIPHPKINKIKKLIVEEFRQECMKCGEIKDNICFNRRYSNDDRLKRQCKDCFNKRRREMRKLRRELKKQKKAEEASKNNSK